jgi:HSP20 family molecular chaperone IbpA
MHESPPDDDEEENQPSDRRENRDSSGFGLGLGGHIGTLLEFLEENADRNRSRPPGRTPSGAPTPRDSDRFSVDLDVSIGSIRDGESADSSPRRRRSRRGRRTADTDEYATAARREGDDVVLTFDLPGVEEDDISVGITTDGDRLLIGADGDELARVPVDDPDEAAIVPTFNNYVLEVRVDGDALAVAPEEVVDW